MKRKTTQKKTEATLKRYQVRKTVMAESLMDAIEKERYATVEHAWLDEPSETPTNKIGFRTE